MREGRERRFGVVVLERGSRRKALSDRGLGRPVSELEPQADGQGVEDARRDTKMPEADKARVYQAVLDLRLYRASAVAQLALLASEGGDAAKKPTGMDRLLAIQGVSAARPCFRVAAESGVELAPPSVIGGGSRTGSHVSAG